MEQEFRLRPYSKRELAHLYFPISAAPPARQVRLIVEYLGEP